MSAVAHADLRRDRSGRDPRHGGVHEPRAGARQAGRPAHRHLVVRLRALRVPHRPAGVRRRDRVGHDRAHPRSASRTGARCPRRTPARVRELLRRCLEKDAKQRLRDIGDARLELEEAIAPAHVERLRHRGRRRGAADARNSAPRRAFALVAAALGATLALRAPEPVPVQRLKLEMPPQPPPPRDVALMALSPDGTMVASSAVDSTGAVTIWVRALASLEGRTVPVGSDDGVMPAFSPDGRFLVFSTQDKLKKVELKGGAPEVLCPLTSYGRGQSWGSRGVIVFSGRGRGPDLPGARRRWRARARDHARTGRDRAPLSQVPAGRPPLPLRFDASPRPGARHLDRQHRRPEAAREADGSGRHPDLRRAGSAAVLAQPAGDGAALRRERAQARRQAGHAARRAEAFDLRRFARAGGGAARAARVLPSRGDGDAARVAGHGDRRTARDPARGVLGGRFDQRR